MRSLLELEVDEGLHVGRLDLNDYEDEDDDEERLYNKWTTGDEVFHLICEELGHEMQYIAQKHEQGHYLVGGAPLKEYLRLELEEYLMEHLFGDAEGGGTEEHPAGGNEVEGDKTSDKDHNPVF